MLKFILSVYRLLFARKFFSRLNKFLYLCSLSGLGVNNYGSGKVTGEKYFLAKYIKMLPRDGYVIDVGANVGNYSKDVLNIAPYLNLFAFEPHPKTYKKLVASIKSENFIAVNAAVGSENGELSLYDYSDKDGSEHASLYKDVIQNIHKANAVEHRVKTIRLGDFLSDNNIDFVDFLKIDTEGNELAVLMGVSEFIEKNKIGIIHFEFNEMNISSKVFFRDFWNLMPNYNFYRLLPSGMVPIMNYSPIFNEIFAYQNIIAINKVSWMA